MCLSTPGIPPFCQFPFFLLFARARRQASEHTPRPGIVCAYRSVSVCFVSPASCVVIPASNSVKYLFYMARSVCVVPSSCPDSVVFCCKVFLIHLYALGRWSLENSGKKHETFRATTSFHVNPTTFFFLVLTAKGVNALTTTTPSIFFRFSVVGCRIRYPRSALPAFVFSLTRQGTVQHDDRVLQPGADLALVLRPDRAAVLHDAPPLAGRLHRVLRDQLQHHPPVSRIKRFLLPGVGQPFTS